VRGTNYIGKWGKSGKVCCSEVSHVLHDCPGKFGLVAM